MRKSPRTWVLAPRGPIPRVAQNSLRARLEKHARTKWKGRCRAVIVRFRGRYAYVDAFPFEQEYMPWHTPEQRAEIDATPMHLCRLGYRGSTERWEYAFYTYSHERYEPSVVASGSFEATPEQAFDCAAGVYLLG